MAVQPQKTAQDTLRSASEKIGSLRDRYKSGEILSDATERSQAIYSQIREELSENPNLLIALAAAGVTFGVAGYLIGKSRERGEGREQESDGMGEEARDVASKATGIDFRPLYKLAKLWMLYRSIVD